jgi:phosphopantetheinyl transferase (holo-ACP synthase)
LIGNDIVDLNLAKTQSNWQRKGFLEKQFTESEQAEILNSENPFLKVWLFWSMKEAAYKCYVQEFQKRFFAPKKFACKLVSNQKGIVEIENNLYYLENLISDNYIHSIAKNNNNLKVISQLFFIAEKTFSTKAINQKLVSFFPAEVQLQKNEIGIPLLYQNQIKLPVSISKSHHGNYGAFAFSV